MSIVSKKINHLSKRGFDVTLLSMTNCKKPFYTINENVHLICCDIESGKIITVLRGLKKAINCIRNGRYDTIISADAMYVTWIIPFIAKARTILEIHQSFDGLVEYYHRSKFGRLNLFIHRMLQRVAFTKYSKIVVLTEEDKKKWNYDNIIVIPNFHCERIISEQCLPNKNHKVIVCIGRYSYQKGVDLLVAVWKIIANKYPNWELHYYGIAQDSHIDYELKRLDAPSSFLIRGYEKDLTRIFSSAYINVVPSRCESFSLTTIEAMCYGVPTVSFDTTGPKSLIDDGIDGYLIERFDIEKMANIIDYLITNTAKRDKMSLNCTIKALLYTEDLIMEKWINLLNT